MFTIGEMRVSDDYLPVLTVLRLKLVIALVEINHLPGALAQNTLRILCMPILFALVQIYFKISTVGGRRINLTMQPKPKLGTTDLRRRTRWIVGVHIVHICTYLVDIGLRTNHPINREIDKILPVDLPHGDAVACCPLSESMTFAVVQLDPSLASLPTRELFLIPQLGDPRRPLYVDSIFPEGNDLNPHFWWIRIPPPD